MGACRRFFLGPYFIGPKLDGPDLNILNIALNKIKYWCDRVSGQWLMLPNFFFFVGKIMLLKFLPSKIQILVYCLEINQRPIKIDHICTLTQIIAHIM